MRRGGRPARRARLRGYALDQRGHGRSSRPGDYGLAAMCDDVVGFLDVLGLDRVDLVGHSMGAYVATLVAAAVPEQVRRLVFEECPIPPGDANDVSPGPKATATSLPWRELFASLRHPTAIRRLLAFDRRMAKRVVAEVRRPTPDWWRALPAMTAPALVVRGGASDHPSRRRVGAMVEALPRARLVTVDGAGHRVHSDRPAAFANLVADFLEA